MIKIAYKTDLNSGIRQNPKEVYHIENRLSEDLGVSLKANIQLPYLFFGDGWWRGVPIFGL